MEDKDFCFYFYPGDYLRDTQVLSEKAQVAYDRIMCEHMRNICVSQKTVEFLVRRLNDQEKEEVMFVLKAVEGGYQIPWVAESISKRIAYKSSRSKNRKRHTDNICNSYDEVMENEIEIENKDSIEARKEDFINRLQPFLSTYSSEMLKDFAEYWTEHNEKGKKMRFEMQKVFDLGRRLGTWSKNQKNFNNGKSNNGSGQKGPGFDSVALSEIYKRTHQD